MPHKALLPLARKTFKLHGIASYSDDSSLKYLFGQTTIGFESLGIMSQLTRALTVTGRGNATLIQSRAIPKILSGSDVIISSETGSGKTLAYLVPVIQKCMEREKGITASSEELDFYARSYPRAVILVPNKDLVNQVVNVGKSLTKTLHDEGFAVSIGRPSVASYRLTIEFYTGFLTFYVMVEALTRSYGSERWPFKDNCPTILACTPGILANFVRGPVVLDEKLFTSIKQLVLDEVCTFI
jgi:superfamily II DNA/RNA helicase